VSAKDKATGKENKITIKASSGLTEDEIQRMVKGRRGARRRGQEAAWSSSRRRNQAEALVHSIKKSLTEYGDKLDGGEKDKIRVRHQDLEGVLEGRGQDGDRGEVAGARDGLAETGREDLRRGAGEDAQGAASPEPQAAGGGAEAAKERRQRVDAEVHGSQGQEVSVGDLRALGRSFERDDLVAAQLPGHVHKKKRWQKNATTTKCWA